LRYHEKSASISSKGHIPNCNRSGNLQSNSLTTKGRAWTPRDICFFRGI